MSKKKPVQPSEPSMRVATIPNAISAFRMLLAIPLWILIQQPYQNRWAVLGVCALGYFSDIADGFMARKLGDESLFGRIIDPLADKVVIITFVMGLVVTGMVPVWFAVIVVARDIVILAGGLFIRVKRGVLAQSTYAGKAAVVSIGLALLISVFGLDVDRSFKLLMYFISFVCISWSLIDYGARFMKFMKQPVRTKI